MRYGAAVPSEVLGSVQTAWASFAGVDRLEPLQVVVNAESALCPAGWIGIVVVGDTVTASVPSGGLALALTAVLADDPTAKALDPGALRLRLPPISEVFGPAALFYAMGLPESGPMGHAVEAAMSDDLESLLGSVGEEKRDESGVSRLTGRVFVARAPDGSAIAAAGYRLWPEQIAHVCVLTHPSCRREGYARALSAAATGHALPRAGCRSGGHGGRRRRRSPARWASSRSAPNSA